MTRYTFY